MLREPLEGAAPWRRKSRPGPVPGKAEQEGRRPRGHGPPGRSLDLTGLLWGAGGFRPGRLDPLTKHPLSSTWHPHCFNRRREPNGLCQSRAASSGHVDSPGISGSEAAGAPLPGCPPAAQRPSWQVLVTEGHWRPCSARRPGQGLAQAESISRRLAWGGVWFYFSLACFLFLLCFVCCSGKWAKSPIAESGWW